MAASHQTQAARAPAAAFRPERESLPLRAPWLTVYPPAPPAAWARRPSGLPFPLGEPGCALFARARHAIWHGVRALGLRDGDEVLAPAYHCGAEIEALLRAGVTCRFYDATETLEPDEPELEALLGPRTRALFLIHYLGFPQDAPRWRRWCDARGLFLIEDAAQAWLAELDGRPVGSFGDVSVFALYKTLGVPDGAALHMRPRPPGPAGRQARGLLPLARRHAAWVMSRPSLAARAASLPLKRRSLRRGRRLPAHLEVGLGDPESPPYTVTRFLLPRLADERHAERRHENYRRLLGEAGQLAPAAFSRLPAGASPFVFPVETDAMRELGRRFARAGVIANDLWSVPHPARPAEGFPGAARLYGRLAILPIHQELRRDDLERMAQVLRGLLVQGGGQ